MYFVEIIAVTAMIFKNSIKEVTPQKSVNKKKCYGLKIEWPLKAQYCKMNYELT